MPYSAPMRRALPSVICLLIGIAIGWLAHPSSPPAQTTETSAQVSSKRKASPRRNPALDRFNLSEMADDGGRQFNRDLEDLSAEDLRTLIDEFQHLAGFNGLTNTQKHHLDKIITQWYLVAPEESLSWINQLENKVDRSKIISSLAEMESEQDLEKGMALVRDNLSPEDGYLLPWLMLQKAVNISEEKYLEVSKLSISSTTSWSSGKLSYPEGFDYSMVLNELEKQVKDSGDQRHGISPSNLMVSWAKADPEAAYDWLQENNATTGHRMTEYVNGLASIRSPQELGIFLAADFDPNSTDHRKYQNIVTALTAKPDASVLASFYADSQTNPADFARNMLEGLSPYQSSQTAGLLLESLPFSERIQIVQSSEIDKNLNVPSFRNGIKDSLISLGHSDEEIAKALER